MLNDFYKKIVNIMGLHVTEDGFIKTSDKKDGVVMIAGGVPLVIPTKEHINSVMGENEDGELIVTKIPFNPLNENVVKGDSVSITKSKLVIERNLGHAICAIGELLLTLASDKEFQKKSSIDVNEFLASINKAQAAGIKQLVDVKSIETWVNIYEKTLANEKGMCSIFLKKSVMKDGTKYNRLATIAFPVYDELLKADKDTPVYGYKLRNKDITIFKLLFEFIIDGLSAETPTISVGSNDTESPAFVSLFTLFKILGDRTHKLLQHVKDINVMAYETVLINTTLISLEDINSAPAVYKSELATIPNEHDLARQKHMASIKSTPISVLNKDIAGIPNIAVMEHPPVQLAPVVSAPVVQHNVPQTPMVNMPQQPTAPAGYVSPMDNAYQDDPIKRMLYSNNVPVAKAYSREQLHNAQYLQPNNNFGMMMGQPNQNIPNMGMMNYQQQTPAMGINSMVMQQQQQYAPMVMQNMNGFNNTNTFQNGNVNTQMFSQPQFRF